MAGKYSGAFVPGAGDDESPAPKRSIQEKYGNASGFDARSRRAEERARIREWMNGLEPNVWWERYENGIVQQFLCMEFPTTVHYFVVAWEKAPEYGKLYTWCFGCKVDHCGACEWARAEYASALREEFKRVNARVDDLPF